MHVSAVASQQAAKVKQFQIYRWNPDQPDSKPHNQVSEMMISDHE